MPPDDDAGSLAPRLDRLDGDALDARGSLSIGIQAGAAWLADGERTLQAMLVASVPLERLAGPPRSRRAGSAPAPSPPPAPAPAQAPPEEAPAAEPPRAQEQEEKKKDDAPALPVRVTPELARAAVEAALRRARLSDPEARIDALATRARASALLPELRLRVAREQDQEQRTSPTDDDPERITASGGASFWLEARATWRLDRVVFSDDEVALERLRRERAEAQRKLSDRVLEALFAWQRARAREADPARSPEERLEATLAAIEAEATLDILTGGWFTRTKR